MKIKNNQVILAGLYILVLGVLFLGNSPDFLWVKPPIFAMGFVVSCYILYRSRSKLTVKNIIVAIALFALILLLSHLFGN